MAIRNVDKSISPGVLVKPLGTSFARPANTTAYAAGDAIASTTVAGDVTPLQWTAAVEPGFVGYIVGAQLITDSATAFAAMRLHLFNTTPFAAGGFQADNAALALTYTALTTGSAGTLPNYIGWIDFTSFVAQSASAVSIGTCDQTELYFDCPSTSRIIFGLLEDRVAFTPASAQNFSIDLNILQA